MSLTRLALFTIAIVLAATGCGGGSEDGSAPTAGREVFIDSCGRCHTLSDAGTTGAVGPNLDNAAPTLARVELQVRNGGGAMPPFEGRLSDEQIASVSRYVAESTG